MLIRSIAVAFSVGLLAPALQAAPTAYRFGGTLFAGGPSLSGTLTFDPEAFDADADFAPPIAGDIEVTIGDDTYRHASNYFYPYYETSFQTDERYVFGIGADTGAGVFPTLDGNVEPTNFGLRLYAEPDRLAMPLAEALAAEPGPDFFGAFVLVGTTIPNGERVNITGILDTFAPAAAPIPEPGAAGLLLASAAGLIVRRRRG